MQLGIHFTKRIFYASNQLFPKEIFAGAKLEGEIEFEITSKHIIAAFDMVQNNTLKNIKIEISILTPEENDFEKYYKFDKEL